jgi:hypothetical protein
MELKFLRYKIVYIITLVILFVNAGSGQTVRDYVNGNLIQFNDNGAWCWFQDERAIIDTNNGKLIVGSVANQLGQSSSRNGDIDAVIYELNSGISQRYLMAKGNSNFGGSDDHNAPAFLLLPNGNYIMFYAGHNNNSYSYYRIYNNGVWGPQNSFNWNTHIPGGTNFNSTYSNLFYLSAEGRTYNFSRGNNKSPNCMISTDQGNSWTYGGQLTMNDNAGYVNGYAKYWSNGVDRIDFVCTELHPRDSSTSIYHGYIKNGQSFKSDGTLVDTNIFDNSYVPMQVNFTKAFANGTIYNGDTLERCWIVDLVRYDDGTIATIVSSRANNNEATGSNYSNPNPNPNPDHRFIYCRFDGTKWSYTYLGKAGLKLYSLEQDYTGLGALCPNDPNTLYISTTIDPRNNSDLGVHEIFKGVTADTGKTWNWFPVTQNSTRDNLRPIVPLWSKNKTALLWWRGTYTSAQLFDAAVVGIIDSTTEKTNLMSYVDADTTNTFMADGSHLVYTGPNGNAGSSDNKWHIRTGAGNNGTILTSSEISGENTPVIKTKVSVPKTGTYDVWVNFWGTPSSDWRIKAGLSSGSMQLFRSMACKAVDSSSHDGTLALAGMNNTYLYQAYLGRVQAAANSSFDVFVDDSAVQVGTNGTLARNDADRTWYDGVSYALVNESSTLGLPGATVLVSPNGSTGIGDVSPHVSFEWNSAPNASSYEFQAAMDANFSHLLNDLSGITDTVLYISIDSLSASFYWRVRGINIAGTGPWSDANAVILTGIDKLKNGMPTTYMLYQNYPNPFNPSTKIRYGLPGVSNVRIKIYNLVGQEVETLVNRIQNAGYYEVTWNAANRASGIYFYSIEAVSANGKNIFRSSKKLILLK